MGLCPPQGTLSPVIPLAYGTKCCAQGTLSPVIPLAYGTKCCALRVCIKNEF